MNVLRRIKYWRYRRKHDHPGPDEIRELVAQTPIQSLRILGICAHFCMSNSLEETAKDFKVTRERIRQLLWKVYWSVHRVARDV